MAILGKDLNLLVALRALLEEANVTRAGDRIQMGQSSMSSALSRLRIQFSDELLVRVGRDFELTPLARLLLPQLQLTMPLIEQALGTEEPFDPATSHRTFRIMMTDYAALELKNLLNRAMLEAPNISIEILALPEQPTDSDRDLVKNDFILAVPDSGVDGSSYPLFVDHFVCIVDKDNPAVLDGKITWEDFVALPQAVCDLGQAHITSSDRKLRSLGFRGDPHVKAGGYLPLPWAIGGTSLVAIVPNRLASRLVETGTIVAVPTPFERIEIVETLWWHPSHDSDPAHYWLRTILTSEAPEIAS